MHAEKNKRGKSERMKKSIYQLAISISHNSSAALMCDGEIIVAVCEERFNKEKNYVGYPKHSIDYCLEKAAITGDQLSRVAYTTVDQIGLLIKAQTTSKFSLKDYIDFYGDKYYIRKLNGEDCLDYLQWLRDADQFNTDEKYFDFRYLTDEVLLNTEIDVDLFRKERSRLLSSHLGIDKKKIEFLDHHTCHAYYAYYGSPYRVSDCIVVTLDGWGDGRNQTVWKVSNDEFELIAESTENDIGRIYKLSTLLLGMRPDEHEFKVMGLAAYAKKSYIEESFKAIEDISEVEGMRIVCKERPKDLYSYLKKCWKGHRFDNIAGAVQKFTEQISVELVRNIAIQTGVSRFVLSGGIAMNVKMNKAISEVDEVREIFVCGSGGDESLSIGGCYLLNEKNGNNKYLNNLYLGYDINDEIQNFDVYSLSDRFDVDSNVSKSKVARLILNGDIIGVVQGKAEFGARALGNRSILANPSIRDSVQKINEAIKNRDFWMPFALSILEENHKDYIENPKNLESPFMSISLSTRPDKYCDIEAGIHPYDKTVRPQFVSKSHNPAFHELISEFSKLSGIPALLNTSFNLHGEPIVDTIADAVRTFELSGLDHLYINETYLISKLKIHKGELKTHKSNLNKTQLLASSEAHNLAEKSIVITGVGRSGTTILGTIIHSFENIEYVFEPPLTMSLLSLINNISEKDWKLLYEMSLYEDFLINAVSGRNLNHNRFDDSSIFSVKEEIDIEKRKNKSLGKMEAVKIASNKIIAYKIPNIVHFFPKLLSYYPKTTLVVIKRNPIYIINSLIAKGWFRNENLAKSLNPLFYEYKKNNIPFWVKQHDADLWIDMNEIDRCAFYYSLFQDYENKIEKKIVVNYDELIKNPSKCVDELANSLNLKYGNKTKQIITSIKSTKINRDLNIINKVSSGLREKIIQSLV